MKLLAFLHLCVFARHESPHTSTSDSLHSSSQPVMTRRLSGFGLSGSFLLSNQKKGFVRIAFKLRRTERNESRYLSTSIRKLLHKPIPFHILFSLHPRFPERRNITSRNNDRRRARRSECVCGENPEPELIGECNVSINYH